MAELGSEEVGALIGYCPISQLPSKDALRVALPKPCCTPTESARIGIQTGVSQFHSKSSFLVF